MADEIIIGKLILDSSDLESSMASSKKAVIDLENEQKKLKKDTEGLSTANEDQLKTFVANELELKKLKSEYSANQKSVLELTKAQTGLDDELAKQNKTQNDAIANTKALTAARRQVDATTVEGAKAITDINAKIDKNNELVRANGSQQEKAATITGNYRQKIFEMSGALDSVIPGFSTATRTAIGFTQTVGKAADGMVTSARTAIGFGRANEELSASNTVLTQTTVTQTAATQATTQATASATTVTGGLSKALGVLKLAIAATGIGLLVIGILAVQQALTSTEAGANKFAKLMGAIGVIVGNVTDKLADLGDVIVGAFESPTKAIEGFGTLLRNQVINRFNGMLELVPQLARAVIQLFKGDFAGAAETAGNAAGKVALGVNGAATAVRKFGEETSKEIGIMGKVSDARAKANRLERELINETQKAQAKGEELRTMSRDAERYSAAERLKFAKQAAAAFGVTDAKEREVLRLRYEAIRTENTLSRTSADAATKEQQALAAVSAWKSKDAVDTRLEIKEQLKINRESAAESSAQAKMVVAESKAKLDAEKAAFAFKKTSTEEQIAFAQRVFNTENELSKKSASGGELQKQLIANRQELSSAILAITDAQIAQEAEAQKKAVEATKAINADLYDTQSQSANDLAFAQIKLLDKALLSEKDYANEVVKINQIKNETLTTIQANFDEAEKVRLEAAAVNAKALSDVQFELRLQDIQDRDATEQEIKMALLTANYEQELILLNENLANKKLSEDTYRASLGLAEKKYSSEIKKNDKILNAQKRAETERTVAHGLDALGSLFEGSKAIAVASALFNTYQGITAELSTKAVTPYEIGLKVANVAFVAASGFAAVKNILKTDKGSSSINASSPRAQTTTGAGNFVNTAQTETVARASDRPTDQTPAAAQPILILETLQEAQTNLAIKLASG